MPKAAVGIIVSGIMDPQASVAKPGAETYCAKKLAGRVAALPP